MRIDIAVTIGALLVHKTAAVNVRISELAQLDQHLAKTNKK